MKCTKTTYLLALLLGLFSNSFSQQYTPNTPLNSTSINEKYLEHLIKIKIDSVRKGLNINPLVNDSILYVASKYHSSYMNSHNKLTHNENDVPDRKTPQLRVEYFGGVNYLVGENVIKSYFNKPMEDKKGREYINTSYEDLANDFVRGWVNSPGHYENIKTKSYEITGVSVSVNYDKNLVYATQKFAKVLYKYDFDENKELFSYSNFKPQKPVSSFDGISNKLIADEFQWKLKPPREKDSLACKTCDEAIENSVYKSKFILKGKSVIFNSYDAPMIAKMIKKRRDGLALEFVSYEAYDCGNPSYYTEPSRRNKQSVFNGDISKPVYRKDLRKGFKKVKRKSKKRKYRWFKNIATKGEPKYFNLKLGKIPKDMNGYIEINLVVIKKKRVCRIMHLTDWCGEDYDKYYSHPYFDTVYPHKYVVVPKKDSLKFSVPFEQGKYDYTEKDIAPILKTVTSSKFNVINAKINAFSSIEGSEKINKNLQQKRAESILHTLTSHQKTPFTKEIKVKENWSLFYNQIDSLKELSHLKEKSKEEIKLIVDENPTKYESYLSKQRKGNVKLFVEFEVGDTLQFLLNEFNININTINEYLNKEKQFKSSCYDSIVNIQYEVYKLIKKGKADVTLLDDFLKKYTLFSEKLPFGFFLDNFWYSVNSSANFNWDNKAYSKMKSLKEIGVKDEYIDFNIISFEINKFIARNSLSDEKLSELYGKINTFLNTNKNVVLLDKMTLIKEDFLIKATKNYHFSSANFDEEKMRNYLNELSNYWKTKPCPDSLVYSLSEFMVFCEQEDIAFNFLEFHIGLQKPNFHHKTLMLYAKLLFQHPKEYPLAGYTDFLKELRNILTKEEWCSIFVGPCNISFQVLDDENFRNFYCTECAGIKNYAQSPEKWEK